MKSNFKKIKDELIASLISLTNSSKFLKTEEVIFLRSELNLMRKFLSIEEKNNELIINTINVGLQVVESPQNNVNVNFNFKNLIHSMDNFYEKADMILDTALSSKKKRTTTNSTLNYVPTSQTVYQPVIKPQIHFKNKIDNSNAPWMPIIRSKPNAIEPLNVGNEVSIEMRNHISSMSLLRLIFILL